MTETVQFGQTLVGVEDVRRAHDVLDELDVPREHEGVAIGLVGRVLLLRHWVAEGRLPVPELMGVTEAAECLGVRTSNLDGIPGLPEAVWSGRRGRVWRASDIRGLAARRRR